MGDAEPKACGYCGKTAERCDNNRNGRSKNPLSFSSRERQYYLYKETKDGWIKISTNEDPSEFDDIIFGKE